MVTRAFRKAGLPNPVRVLGDGDAAVAYLTGDGEYADRAAHPIPALVLLDLKLPRRSGLEVLAWLKARPGLRRLPVAVLTSSAESPDVAAAYDLGANSYLLKPTGPDALLALVRALGAYWTGMNYPPETDPGVTAL